MTQVTNMCLCEIVLDTFRLPHKYLADFVIRRFNEGFGQGDTSARLELQRDIVYAIPTVSSESAE